MLCSTRFRESLPWWWSFLDFLVMANDSNCLHPSNLHFNQRLPSPHRSTIIGSLSISYPSEVATWHIKLKCHWFQFVLTQQAVMYVSQRTLGWRSSEKSQLAEFLFYTVYISILKMINLAMSMSVLLSSLIGKSMKSLSPIEHVFFTFI